MKKILYLFLLLLPVLGLAQSRYGVEGVPMCWTTALGVDSSIIRYVLVSTTGQPVKTIVHENASGVVVNVSGGTLRYGFCDCAGGLDSLANGSVTWAKLANPVKDSINKSVTWSRLANPVKDSIRIGMNQKRDTCINFVGNYNLSTAVGDDKIQRLYRKITLDGNGPGSKVILTLPDGGLNMTDVDLTVVASDDTIQVQAAVNDGIYPKFRKVNPNRINEYKCVQIGAGVLWKGSVWDSLGVGGQSLLVLNKPNSNPISQFGIKAAPDSTKNKIAKNAIGTEIFTDTLGNKSLLSKPYDEKSALVIIWIANQSNGFGSTPFGDLPANYQIPTDTVKMWDYIQREWVTYNPRPSPEYAYHGWDAYIKKYWPAAYNGQLPVYIIKWGAGGQKLDKFAAHFNNNIYQMGRYLMWEPALDALLKQGIEPNIILFQGQGEDDYATTPATYKARLDSVVNYFTDEFVGIFPNAPYYLIEIPQQGGGGRDLINNVFAQVESERNNVHLIRCRELAVFDGIHYNTVSMDSIAGRLFRKIRQTGQIGYKYRKLFRPLVTEFSETFQNVKSKWDVLHTYRSFNFDIADTLGSKQLVFRPDVGFPNVQFTTAATGTKLSGGPYVQLKNIPRTTKKVDVEFTITWPNNGSSIDIFGVGLNARDSSNCLNTNAIYIYETGQTETANFKACSATVGTLGTAFNAGQVPSNTPYTFRVVRIDSLVFLYRRVGNTYTELIRRKINPVNTTGDFIFFPRQGGGGSGFVVDNITAKWDESVSIYPFDNNSIVGDGGALPYRVGASGVSAGTYGSTTQSPVIVIGADGRILSASNATISGGGGLSGLTTNTMPKATSSTTIGNSQVIDNGTSVGVGISPPGSGKLHVEGNLQVDGNIVFEYGSNQFDNTGLTWNRSNQNLIIGGSATATIKIQNTASNAVYIGSKIITGSTYANKSQSSFGTGSFFGEGPIITGDTTRPGTAQLYSRGDFYLRGNQWMYDQGDFRQWVSTDGNGAFSYGGATFTTHKFNTSNGGTDLLVLYRSRIGVGGITAPSARLHLPAGQTTATNAPLKFTSGANMTTPEAGAIEYNGTDFFGTDASRREVFIRGYKGSGSPEGIVTAPVGSIYLRLDGGAGTSFYIKESGTGNTGWVAK